MSAFPGAGAVVYRNEAGEPLGWDYPPDPSEFYYDDYDRFDEQAYEPDNPCDYCGENIDSDRDEVRIKNDTKWGTRIDYLHHDCAKDSARVGTYYNHEGHVIEEVPA